jgi:hypothetical protein
VFHADVDGDGDLDLVSASINDDSVFWHENLFGDGSSWADRLITDQANGAWTVHAADMDGDGDQDVLWAAFFDDTFAWHENLAGDGSVWEKHVIRNIDLRANWIRAVDMDGDGDMDALSTAIGFDIVAWHENVAGDGLTWVTRLISAATRDPQAAVAADMDLDGDMDVVVASANDNLISYFENGGGGQWTQNVVTFDALFADAVDISDVDGDGDPDIVTSSANDDTIAWYENLQVPFVWPKTIINVEFRAPASVFAADVDQDGDVDVLSASSNDDSIVFHDNLLGDGSLWIPRTITSVANEVRSVAAADLDGDGDPDVFSASLGDDRVAWYENGTIHRSASYPFTTVISTQDAGPGAVISADLDGDGNSDVVSASEGDDRIVLYANQAGDGSLWSPSTIADVPLPTSVFAGDVNGDGALDILAASAGSDSLSWYDNTGTSWPQILISAASPAVASVHGVDLDADGDLDAVAASPGDDTVAWHENTAGDGSAWSAHILPALHDEPVTVFGVDMDRDGDGDVLAGFSGDHTLIWYENTPGDGSEWIAHTISSTSIGVRWVHGVDMDRDGDMDVLSASAGSNTVAWDENAGDGVTWARHVISASVADVQSVVPVDLDADGDLDALSASAGDDTLAWHENSGDGTTWTTHRFDTGAPGATAAVAADLDGDGKLDVLSASFGDDTLAWHPNRGGQFRLTTADTAPPAPFEGGAEALLRIRATHAGRTGDPDLQLASLELVLDDGAGNLLDEAQANALIENLQIYADDGSGSFEGGVDSLVTTVGSLEASSGVQAVTFLEGDPSVQVPHSAPRDYFVVTEFAAGASSQVPNTLRVTHAAVSGSTAADPYRNIPLALEFTVDVGSSTVTIGLDADSDLVSNLLDCDDSDPSVFPGAPEVNDGADNQCPGDPGAGIIDEISGAPGFRDPAFPELLSWDSQAGATLYELARSATPDFSAACSTVTVAAPSWEDPEVPSPGAAVYYLVRALQPNVGSWGESSPGSERFFACP